MSFVIRWIRQRLRAHPKKCAAAFGLVLLLAADVFVGTTWLLVARVQSGAHPEHRVPDRVFHHGLRPMSYCESEVWGQSKNPIFVNSLGFKDKECRTVRAKCEQRRIVVIGDSFTEGIGIRFEDTFVGLVESRMASHDIEVLNAGVVSYSPIIYLRKIRWLLEDIGLQFTELVVFVDLSDAHDETLYEFDLDGNVTFDPSREFWAGPNVFPRNRFTETGMRAALHWTRYSFAGRLWTGAESRRQAAHPIAVGLKRGAWTHDKTMMRAFASTGLKRGSRHMSELLALLRSHGIRMSVAVYPWPEQVVRRERECHQETFWKAWAEQNDVPFLTFFPAFISDTIEPEANVRRYFIPGDVHWNQAGHRLVAERLLDFMASDSYSDQRRPD